MPVYVFQCESCGHEFSVMTSWSKKAETTCPQCGASRLKEQFGQYRVGSIAGNGSNGAGDGGACSIGGG